MEYAVTAFQPYVLQVDQSLVKVKISTTLNSFLRSAYSSPNISLSEI